LLWNAGRTVADYLEENKATLLKDKTVLELGAGAGLPSLIAGLYGARYVVVTDYPDHDLVENLQKNIDCCDLLGRPRNVSAAGYLWGANVSPLVQLLPNDRQGRGFDLLILADLLFNHSEHHKLVKSVQDALTRSASAQALVFFTPYRPWLLQKDLAFFDLAKEGGFVVEKILEKTMDKVMFEEDRGVSGSSQ
jgi:nicotinamide N-methyltransferase